ncbi:MAG: NfeD family protein [Acidovorax sp.]
MDASTLWWLASGAAVIAELLTGTFYLLMLAIGFVAGALAAHAGAAVPQQFVAAALTGALAVAACYLVRKKRQPAAPAASNPDVNLDVGETVTVAAWNADGTAQVRYRGAQWTVALQPGAALADALPGPYRVAEVVGNRLIVNKA